MEHHGATSPYDPTQEDWMTYIEHLEMYFLTNEIWEAAKKRGILLKGNSTKKWNFYHLFCFRCWIEWAMSRLHAMLIRKNKGRQILGLPNINDVIICVTSLRAVGHVVIVESNTKCVPVLLLSVQTEAGNVQEFRSTTFRRKLNCTRGGLLQCISRIVNSRGICWQSWWMFNCRESWK